MFDFASPGGPTFFPSRSGGITTPFSFNLNPSGTGQSQVDETRQAESGTPWYVRLIEAGTKGVTDILREVQGRPTPGPSPKYEGATADNPAQGGAEGADKKPDVLLWVAIGAAVLGLGAGIFAIARR